MIKDLKKYIAEHRYCLLLIYIPVYLVAFFVIDGLPAEHYIIECPLDSYIPFNQYMVIAYIIWYGWFPGWLIFFLLNSKGEFKCLAIVMFSGMTISLLIYVIWPNGIDLREPIMTTDACSKIVELIRSIDTPYGVCPSIHISSVVAIALSIYYSKLTVFTDTAKAYCVIIALLICYSTMAIKQHSIIDVAAGALLSLLLFYLYPLIYKHWRWLREL